MNPSPSSRAVNRARRLRRVGQLTRWSAAGGGLAAVVIGVLLARGPAVASTTTGSSPAPSEAPQPSHHSGSHTLSGAS